MTDRELMQQALEALEWHLEKGAWGADIEGVAAALRERLAQPEQEPVAGEYATCLEDGERVLIASVLPVGYGGNKTRTVRVVWPDGMDGVYTMFQFARLFSPIGELEQEPVAHVDHRIHGWPDCFVMEAEPPHTSPLYTTPPRREWVGLTEEEVYPLANAHLRYQPESYSVSGIYDLARTIEAKLKEKNA